MCAHTFCTISKAFHPNVLRSHEEPSSYVEFKYVKNSVIMSRVTNQSSASWCHFLPLSLNRAHHAPEPTAASELVRWPLPLHVHKMTPHVIHMSCSF